MLDMKWSAVSLIRFDLALQDTETGILGDSKHNLFRVPLSYLSEDKRKVIWADAVWKGALALSSLLHSSLLALLPSFRGEKSPAETQADEVLISKHVMYVSKKQCFNMPTIQKKSNERICQFCF